MTDRPLNMKDLDMLNLSRSRVRTAIWEMLQADDPIRHRWLQEHPRTNEIVNQLTSDTIDLMTSAYRERSSNPTTGYWASLTDTEIEPTAVEMVLGSPDLWDAVETEFPRTSPAATPTGEDLHEELMHDVPMLPVSRSTDPNSSPED